MIVKDLSSSFNPYPKQVKKEKKEVKPIKKVSDKRTYVKEQTYNTVFKRDKGKCRLCKKSQNLELHHIDGRGKNLTNNIDNCIMLCQTCHRDVVHKNQKKYRPILKEIIRKEKNKCGKR